MIKIDEENSMDVKLEDNKIKIVLKLKKDHSKMMHIEFFLKNTSAESLISKLISTHSKTKAE